MTNHKDRKNKIMKIKMKKIKIIVKIKGNG